MGNIDKKVLNDIYNTSKIGLDSVEFLYRKVKDEDLKEDLNEYVRKYYDILNETRYRLELLNEKPKDYTPVSKAMMWTGLQANTLLNDSSSKIAEILIQGSTKGIVEMTKSVNNDIISEDIRKIANTLIHYEKENINNIKKHI